MNVSLILLYVIGVIVFWLIFYYVVKTAVKNGITEARGNTEVSPFNGEYKADKPANARQIILQQQYDKGEISFDVYQSEWKKLGD